MTKALQNVVPSHLMDTQLHDFTGANAVRDEQAGMDLLNL